MPRIDMTHESMRHYYRGRVFESTGEIDVAIEEYRKAIEIGADYADVHNSLGRVYAKRGLFEEARKEFNIALKINPHYLEAIRNLDEIETKAVAAGKEQLSYQKQAAPPPLPGQEQKPLPPLPLRRKRKAPLGVIAAVAAGVLVIGVSAVFGPKLFGRPVVATYIAPSKNIAGIAVDGRTVWLSDWLKQEVYRCALDSGGDLPVKDTFKMPKIYPFGIAVGDGYLWTCDAWSKKIYQHVPDSSLTVLKSFDAPQDESPSGLCWDGKNIWSCDSNTGRIYQHDKDDKLTVKASFPTSAEQLVGFFWDGKNYWSVDGARGMIYRHRPDGKLSVQGSYPMNLGNRKIGGVFIDRKYIWVAFDGEGFLTRYPRSKIIK